MTSALELAGEIPWQEAEAYFARLCAQSGVTPALASARLPFKQRALAYLEAVDELQTAAALGVDSSVIAPSFATDRFTYAAALTHAKLSWKKPAQVSYALELHHLSTR